MQWRQVDVTSPLEDRYTMAWDAVGERMIVYSDSGQTLSWDGTHWQLLQPEHAPPPRRGHRMVTDAARRRIVLFGGWPLTPDGHDDTWEWDGDDWIEVHPATRPLARGLHAMAYDLARARVVMFGGQVGNDLVDETWEWDGLDWTLVPDAGAPAPRTEAAMAWHPPSRRMVLFGGSNGTSSLGDTWERDGTTWRRVSSGGGGNVPAPRQAHAMALHTPSANVLMYGGDTRTATSAGGDGRADAWLWNGIDWQPQPDLQPARFDASLAMHPGRGTLLLFGGCWQPAARAAYCYVDAHEWNGLAWRALSDRPRPRAGGVMAHLRERGVTVLAGGHFSISQLPLPNFELWTWNGAAWHEGPQLPSPALARTNGVQMAEDEARKVVVIVHTSGDRYLSVAEYDGSQLQPRSSSHAAVPTERTDFAVAYDAVRDRVVLFGGRGDGVLADVLADTWTWDGTRWEWQRPPTSPPPRGGHGMAFDPLRNRIVLFGGYWFGGGGVNDVRHRDDTWEWDGESWHAVATTANRPAPRAGHRLVHDARRQRVMLFGGEGPGGTLDDAWDWNGAQWSRLGLPPGPAPRAGAAMAYDVTRSELLLFGGRIDPQSALGDLWVLR